MLKKKKEQNKTFYIGNFKIQKKEVKEDTRR